MGRQMQWYGLLLVAVTVAACATVQIAEQRVISGRITDQQGRPVPETPVLVVSRKIDLNMKLEYQ